MAFFKKKPISVSRTTVGKPEYIIAGLGNPGKEYEFSRHNSGFLCIDLLCNKYHVVPDRFKFNALTVAASVNGHSCLIMRPQTYMNNSGESIAAAAAFYKIQADHVIVVYDDISLQTGVLRIRLKGSAGGHNGIKSIIAHLGTEEFPRLKLGVGERKDPDSDLKDHVLGKFSKADLEKMRTAMEKAVLSIELIVDGKPDEAMNKYNG